MFLEPGQRLGAYEIRSAIGVGGMGEVYRAADTKLHRDVALKILPEAFATDPDRLARFEREAHVLASLNHPNIAAIYGIEDGPPEGADHLRPGVGGGVDRPIRALVLELVDGPTLADRLATARIPLDEALNIGRQIAEALGAAHEHGIVHRDLKPANIKVRTDGTVKVLDFGLAKIADPAPGSPVLPESPTVTSPAVTRAGVILGTAAYMAPEQATGKTADTRSDIWAFGLILYEMITGRRGFRGETTVEVLSNVLKAEPDWTALPSSTPSAVRSLLHRCLQKDPARRLRDITDAGFQIEEALTAPAGAVWGSAPVPAPKTYERLAWVGLVVAVAAAAVGTARYLAPPPVEAREVRFEIPTPPSTDPTSLAVSPDGRQIVFLGTSEQKPLLWLQSLDAKPAQPLAGTDDASQPFWSPDSRSVAFFAHGKLKHVDLDSGSVQTLAPAAAFGGAWNREGTILFTSGPGGPLMRTSVDGKTPIVVVPSSLQANVLKSPVFLPDDRHFLFHAEGTDPGIYVGQLGGEEPPKRILDARAATYASSGHLLFVRQGTLFAQAFDTGRLELTGDSTPVAERIVASSQGGAAALSVSAAGPIAYRTGSATLQSQFIWFDRSGGALEAVVGSDVGSGFNSSLSPDGRRLAMSRNVGGTAADIWLLDLNRGVLSRFTFDEAFDLTPVWSPDGLRIAFSSNRKGTFDPYVKPAGRIGEDELLETNDAGPPSDWSPDGRFILRSRQRAGHDDIWALAVDGDRKAFPVVETTFNESNGQFSPDGKWIAYQSNESGQMEIYVQAFPGPAQKTRISSDGGVQVRWRHDGQELFYLAPDDRLMAVSIRFDSNGVDVGTPVPATPVPLFATRMGGTPGNNYARTYMVSRDGQRFLVDTLKEVTLPITVVLNWKPNR